jgi:hypothetical protein
MNETPPSFPVASHGIAGALILRVIFRNGGEADYDTIEAAFEVSKTQWIVGRTCLAGVLSQLRKARHGGLLHTLDHPKKKKLRIYIKGDGTEDPAGPYVYQDRVGPTASPGEPVPDMGPSVIPDAIQQPIAHPKLLPFPAAEPTDDEELLALRRAQVAIRRAAVDERQQLLNIDIVDRQTAIDIEYTGINAEEDELDKYDQLKAEEDEVIRRRRAQLDVLRKQKQATVQEEVQVDPDPVPDESKPDQPAREVCNETFGLWWIGTIVKFLARHKLKSLRDFPVYTDVAHNVKLRIKEAGGPPWATPFTNFTNDEIYRFAIPAVMRVEEALKSKHKDLYRFTGIYKKHWSRINEEAWPDGQ